MSHSRSLGTLPRRLRRAGDTGSMPLAVLFTIVGVGLSSLLLPMAVTQIRSTRTQEQRVQALQAAQTGLNVALGRIRAAHNAGMGRLDLLPCGPLSGSMQTDGGQRFDVEIFYLNVDPRGRARDQAWINANKQTCGAQITSYALLRSLGTDGSATRRLWGTYAFRTTNEPVVGGLIAAYPSATLPDICMDAGSATPPAGTLVRMLTCHAGAAQQTWAYKKNLTITLVSSHTAANPAGLCLDAGSPHAVGRLVRLQPCADPATAQQRWSFTIRANFEGTSDNKTLDDYCINVQSPGVPGSPLVLGSHDDLNCNNAGVLDTRQTFAPKSAVGAGLAGVDSGQLVNFAQFGRCVDLPQKTNPAWLSAYPCNQAPAPEDISSWEKWALPSTPGGPISTVPFNRTLYPADTYCLASPGAPGQYVDAAACPSGSTPRSLRWTVRGYTGTYATSYRIEDDYGYCLAAKDTALGDFHNDELEVSKVIVTQCGPSGLQKWNAPADIAPSRFTDFGEE